LSPVFGGAVMKKGCLCGADEAGRGPVLGPLVVACIRIPDNEPLRKLGAKDSKALTPAYRERLAPEITKLAEVRLEVLEAEDLNVQMGEGTMNVIEVRAFIRAIGALVKDGDEVFVDAADVDAARFGREIGAGLGAKDIRITSTHKADSRFPVVSAASIVAKVERDRRMRDIERALLDLAREKGIVVGPEGVGSGYPSDKRTVHFIEKWIKTTGDTPPHTRTRWETIQRLTSLKNTRSLDDFG